MVLAPFYRKERKSSVIYVSGRWTADRVNAIQPPPESTRFRVFYGTLATATNRAGSEWIAYPDNTPQSWIEAQFGDYSRVISIVFDKA